jgi:hypothetical protein
MGEYRMLEMLGPLMMVYVALVALAIPFVIYVIARWRAHRDRIVDSQLGIKVALGYFAVTAFQVVLAGVTMLFYAVLSNMGSDEKSSFYRGAAGLIVPAAIVLGSHIALLGRTNELVFPGVRRLLLGFNLFLTGTIGFVALVMAFEALFGKGSAGEMGRVSGAMVLVYGSAWAAVGVQFGRQVLGGYTPPDEPPPAVPTESKPATPSGPTLPPLGGGAYPPIDRK